MVTLCVSVIGVSKMSTSKCHSTGSKGHAAPFNEFAIKSQVQLKV